MSEELDRSSEKSRVVEQFDLPELAQFVAGVAAQAAAEVVSSQMRAFYIEWSGPVPSPDDCERFEQLQPGFAERIMTMAEKRADHLAASQMRELDIQEQGIDAQDRANQMNRDVSVRAIDSHTYTSLAFLAVAAIVAITVDAWPGVVLGAVPLSRYLFMFIQEARNKLRGTA